MNIAARVSYNQQRRERLKAAGLCVTCGQEPASPGRTDGDICRERRRGYHAKSTAFQDRYARLKAAGLCVNCGKADATCGVMCEPCADKARRQKRESKYRTNRYQTLKIQGLCVICAKAPTTDGRVSCRPCTKRATDKQRDSGYTARYTRHRREQARAAGLCGVCWKVPAEKGQAMCLRCREVLKGWRKKTEQGKKQYQRLRAEGRCTSCYKVITERSSAKNQCQPCHDRYHDQAIERGRRKRAALRDEILQVYGRRCACCGDTTEKFLTLDHINNDGAAHRKLLSGKNITGGGSRFYAAVKADGFPNTFQLLCWNCNLGKYLNGGACPHAITPTSR